MLKLYKYQRLSRGHKARGQGQGHKKVRGQGKPFRGQTLSRPGSGMLEAKGQEHRRKCSPKKKALKIFSGDILQNFFSGDLQNFCNLKNTAVLEPRTGQFSRT